MPAAALIVPILLSAAQAAAPPITVTGHAWAPFISPMGEPFRARTKTDNTLANWFSQADRDRDGLLTAAEMEADAQRFFVKLDANRDGEIDPDELVRYEWEVAPDIQVMSKKRRAPGEAAPRKPESEHAGYGPPSRKGRDKEDFDQLGIGGGLQGAARYALLNIPEPVASADSDLNRGITASEFRQAAIARFHLLDSGRQGKLTLAKLEIVRAAALARKPKRDSKAPDERVAIPIPVGD